VNSPDARPIAAVVRPALDADLDHLAVVWHDAWHEAHDGLVPEELSRVRTLQNCRERLTLMLPAVRVVGQEGRPLGFCQVKEDELYQLFVSQEARGGGVAAALARNAEEEIRRRGFTRAWLACAIGNERAARFYEKSGWRRTGVAINFAVTPTGQMPLEVWRYEKALFT
jgi:ribosomal protein S18 acetylase RimI-like enzyme